MTLSYHLGLYSTNRKNRLRQTIKIVIIIATAVLLFLIGQQIFFKINSQQAQIIAPKSENILDTISKLASKKSLVIKSLKEKPDMIILLLEGEVEVLLDKKKSIDSQLEALQLITSQDKINGRKAKKIDLRFNNPIVVY